MPHAVKSIMGKHDVIHKTGSTRYNISEADRATALGNMYRRFREVWTCRFRDMRADRQRDKQTDRHTHTLIGDRSASQKRAYYRNHCIDSNQILHNDKDRRVLFARGPNTRTTNPRLECGPMPSVMAALPNIGGALCSTLQSLADAQY